METILLSSSEHSWLETTGPVVAPSGRERVGAIWMIRGVLPKGGQVALGCGIASLRP